ncbi:MAG: radical SAM protein, partial [Candidatus Omnitrophica bacterium]|nr:radical SAM protein [Candidatus Omnitrophota bacterium]
PYVRGKERSRDIKDIVKEVKDLAARGFKEIMLLGQNVNSYGRNIPPPASPLAGPRQVRSTPGGAQYARRTTNFVKLLGLLNEIRGIECIRFMTSHPKDANIGLFKAIRDLEKVSKHLHLPLQSGSDRILKLMNRGYTARRYLRLVNGYKRIMPGGSITTDVIVGFPSETKADFNKTLEMMKDIQFDGAYMFKYSPRPPARSARLKDSVPQKEKEKRLNTLLNLQKEISLKKKEKIA